MWGRCERCGITHPFATFEPPPTTAPQADDIHQKICEKKKRGSRQRQKKRANGAIIETTDELENARADELSERAAMRTRK